MPVTANEQTVDTVNTVNIKNIGELHALTAGLSGQNLLTHQQRINEIANSTMQNAMTSAQQIQHNGSMLAQAMAARASRFLFDISAEQAAAFEKTLGTELADRMSELGAAVSGVQQQLKGAQTTAPQTGTGGAFGSDQGSALLNQLANQNALIVQQLTSLTAALEALRQTPGT